MSRRFGQNQTTVWQNSGDMGCRGRGRYLLQVKRFLFQKTTYCLLGNPSVKIIVVKTAVGVLLPRGGGTSGGWAGWHWTLHNGDSLQQPRAQEWLEKQQLIQWNQFNYRVSVFNSIVCISSWFFSLLPCVGIVDNSGIRFTVTPTLRLHDAGILEFTAPVDTNQVIPPHQSNFVSSVYCNESTLTEVCLYYT